MNLDAYVDRIARRCRRNGRRRRWASELVSKTRLNPEYAIERIREWLGDPTLTLATSDSLSGIAAANDDGRIVFAAQAFPEARCERWNGREMVAYWGAAWPLGDFDWPVGPGASAIPESATPTILDKVFDHLTLRDLKNCARVNRVWRACANASGKVRDLVPPRYRGYVVQERYRGKNTREVAIPDLRMATLFAPWEIWETADFDAPGVPNSIDLLTDVLIAWFAARAPEALKRSQHPDAIRSIDGVRGRPAIRLSVPCRGGIAYEFRVLARAKSESWVHLGINSLAINGRWKHLGSFVDPISDAFLEAPEP